MKESRLVLTGDDITLLRSVLPLREISLLDALLGDVRGSDPASRERLREAVADAMMTEGLEETTGALSDLGERLDDILDRLAEWNVGD